MTEIIVYRNPLEAAMWNAIGNGSLFPIIVAIVAFFVVFLTAERVARFLPFKYVKAGTNAALVLGAFVSLTLMFHMYSSI